MPRRCQGVSQTPNPHTQIRNQKKTPEFSPNSTSYYPYFTHQLTIQEKKPTLSYPAPIPNISIVLIITFAIPTYPSSTYHPGPAPIPAIQKSTMIYVQDGKSKFPFLHLSLFV
ncbi:hypothetical protein GQ44DRAFT_361962 [Phaeosphaeriaceae sp. PMI808]|nr:hypothetical protein GQ44DRAFT_361962 [Phaeosphaeriaceae sp. PMI808]